ncbi:unnamed protein product [Ixodes pacificus]
MISINHANEYGPRRSHRASTRMAHLKNTFTAAFCSCESRRSLTRVLKRNTWVLTGKRQRQLADCFRRSAIFRNNKYVKFSPLYRTGIIRLLDEPVNENKGALSQRHRIS